MDYEMGRGEGKVVTVLN